MGPPRAPDSPLADASSDESRRSTNTSKPVALGSRSPMKGGSRTTSGTLKSVSNLNPKSMVSSRDSPQKPSNAASKLRNTKPTADPKSKGGIQSFFSAATQRPQPTQQLPRSQSSTPGPQDIVETIDSDDDHKSSSVAVSKASSTALAVRKRKAQQTETSLGSNLKDQVPPASQKFRKTGEAGRAPSLSAYNADKRPWTEQFAPTNLDELAVHKRKVADVRGWLDSAFNGKRNRTLVLKGAAGTGKTTTLKMLAEALNVEITEWRNSAGSEYVSETSQSATSQFQEFLSRSGRSHGLTLTGGEENESRPSGDRSAARGERNDKQLLLIEEFPNTFSRSSQALQSFRSTIAQFLASSSTASTFPTPVVLIVSETLLSTSTAAADSFTAHRLLGPELVNHPYLDTIEFNAVAPTILLKALELAVVKEARRSGRRTTPGPLVLKRLAEFGDVRSAMSSLEFMCLRGDDADVWSSKVAFTKPKKKSEPPLTKAEEEALRLISNRETSLDIFHSVGKVVYNKRVDPPYGVRLPQPPNFLPHHHRPKRPENDVNQLVDEIGTDSTTFVAALHENYALSCSTEDAETSLHCLSGCVESLSDADLLSLDRFSLGTRAFTGSATDSLHQAEMSFQVAVRGLLFSLPAVVQRGLPANGRRSDAYRMYFPASLKLWRRREEIEGLLEILISKLTEPAHNAAGTGSSTSESHGVASWKRGGRPNLGLDTERGNDFSHVASSTSAKAEWLMERLPYLSAIMQSSTSVPGVAGILDQIRSVTRVTGQDLDDHATDDEADAVETQGDEPTGVQWATDRSEEKKVKTSRRGPTVGRNQTGRRTEGDGLRIPVETQVEKLVLEDDDIVDDD